ncbi:GrpB family protein [Fervidibacillus albus]|uniref:GrpB family protein n=1 Tax=Fervidibacillus albus TaxID=2980026 RepID=A0A9E8LSV0_9BACI|nr:GrpB family protein [Fervidibacillus albus]WAA08983.1 GrpB family protein [Fervidibacillus albus]
MARHIIVKEYNPLWPELFEKEASRISKILGKNLVSIHHIGSTSVVGLAAKPIIDIMPVVEDLKLVDLVANEFEQIGYDYLGEFGIEGRRYLRKGGDNRTHHIHIFSKKNIHDIERHLAVRDYLRTHKDICDKYAKLKMDLAKKYPYDSEGYRDGKAKFVEQLEQDALKWKHLST